MNPAKQNAKSLFLEAIEKHAPEQWEAYLDEACADDAELRRRVERLLEAHREDDNLFDHADRTVDHSPLTETAGTIIGPYKLREQIGEGGMGVVFVAERSKPYRQKVALKIVKPGMDTKEIIARFEAERQTLALMDHPNIARVLDAGTTDSGRPYFVMELVKGVPIIDYCDQQQLTTRARLDLFASVCRAVQHAHSKGIIHRDLKPSNIMVAPHDGKPVVKVIDFGVAKAIGQQLTDKTISPRFAQMIGTPLYMSPEQAEINALDVDTRSDIYSLGVLLYELLTGTTPFDRKRFATAAHEEIRRIIREEEPPSPSRRLSTLGETLPTVSANRKTAPAKLSSVVKGDLDWIVMKALEKDRTRRYETANGFAADIRRYLGNEAIEARPPSTLYRLRKYVSRHKTGAVSAISIATAILLGVLGITFGLWHAQATQQRAANVARRQAFEYGINLAYEAWNRGNRNEFEEVMRYLGAEAREEERRGFEWRYLWAQYEELFSAELVETSTKVMSVSYSADGRYLAVGSADETAIVRDCVTGKVMSLPDYLTGNRVAFSPKGTYLFASCRGHDDEEVTRLQLWRFPSFERITWPDGPSGEFTFVVFSRDESCLAGVRADGVIEIRNVMTGELVGECRGHSSRPVALAFSPNGRLLASGGGGTSDQMLRLWSITGKMLDENPPPVAKLREGGTQTLAFTPDGQYLVVGGWCGATLWKVIGERLQQPLPITGTSVQSVAFSSEGMLALGCADQTVRIWDLGSAKK